jgi:hypothetical protein
MQAKVDAHPTFSENAKLHYPVDCKIHQQTLICGNTDLGDGYCPLLVSGDPHVMKVFDTGVRNGSVLRSKLDRPLMLCNLFSKSI